MTQTYSAAELIALAGEATSTQDLDDIESEANGRVTVLEAIARRREELAMADQAPIVDPSPTAAPIFLGDTELHLPPAEASPQEVLDLKPNKADAATEGPHAQIDPNTYVHMTKPDGTAFLAPLSNVPAYEAKGFTAGSEEVIPDLVAYWAAKAES